MSDKFDPTEISNPKRTLARREEAAEGGGHKPASAPPDSMMPQTTFTKGKRPANPQRLAEMLRKHRAD